MLIFIKFNFNQYLSVIAIVLFFIYIYFDYHFFLINNFLVVIINVAGKCSL